MTLGHRLFFALKPAANILPDIGVMRREYCPEGAIPDHRWHVTLDILADNPSLPDSWIRKAMRAGAAIDVAGFILRFDRIVGLGGWVGLRTGRRSTGPARLHRTIRDEITRVGLPPMEGWSFNPHLTLGYPKGRIFSRAVKPIEWEANEIVLIHSHLGQTRHDPLGRWPLAPELPLFQ